MNILVTGGAGFIGRAVVKTLLQQNHNVYVLDDLSNGRIENINEFINDSKFIKFYEGDIKNIQLLKEVFQTKFDICYHLAASINVQDSIDDPKTTFENDTMGTFNILQFCKEQFCKIVFMSTCMVYDVAKSYKGIDELHQTKPASPYAGSKIAAENMVLSFYHAYKLPVVVIRPFNTYGPFQKTGGEGGVVAIFIKKALDGQPLNIYGDGTQTRDLLFVDDCAEFIVKSGFSDAVNGEIINAGLGNDITINDLALLIANDKNNIKHVEHIHPQSEIKKLLCNYEKAKRLLNWEPNTSLDDGIKKTKEWIIANRNLI